MPFNNNGICYKTHAQVDTTANWSSYFSNCSGGEFDGLNGSCYTCPSGYSHDSALTVGTSGVCYADSSITANVQGDITFVCPLGQFLDLGSGSCYACPSGYLHNPALPGDTTGVRYTGDDRVAQNPTDAQFLCPAGSFADAVTGSVTRARVDTPGIPSCPWIRTASA